MIIDKRYPYAIEKSWLSSEDFIKHLEWVMTNASDKSAMHSEWAGLAIINQSYMTVRMRRVVAASNWRKATFLFASEEDATLFAIRG